MTTSEFIKIKKTAFTPAFKELVGLKTVENNGAFLSDFGILMHPGVCKVTQGSKLEVFGKKHYIYTLYQGLILRTEAETTARKAYRY